jgi:UDP-N-acetylmuramate: L-alanyl-gamma-D-glutamyl-meso-diaminopimelate ligase
MRHEEPRLVYLMGIGGIAMGTLAGMLQEAGYQVIGSDRSVYPPMSTFLEQRGIQVFSGYHENNLLQSDPDLVVIGNVIRRENPEAQWVMHNGCRYISMPEAIDRFFLAGRRSLVAAGTHGKSTTSALLGWVLEQTGTDPTLLVGAFLKDRDVGYRLGSGPHMVLEGDEYDSAFFDKGPKFLHYRPHIAIITSIEFDHADIFRDFDHVFSAFRSFVQLIPTNGTLIVNGDDPGCRVLAEECAGQVLSYGESRDCSCRILDISYGAQEVQCRLATPWQSDLRFRSRLPGRHNAANVLAVHAAASLCGVSAAAFQEALLAFPGIKRRQDVLSTVEDIVVIDDFAHHPTAVRETIEAIARFYPGHRLLAVFEPRTNSSRRRFFQQDYAVSFDHADWIAIVPPADMDKVPEQERLDIDRLIGDIKKRGKDARQFADARGVLHALLEVSTGGDVVLFMSNGSFEGLPGRFFEALRRQSETA